MASTYNDEEVFVQSYFEGNMFKVKSSKNVSWTSVLILLVQQVQFHYQFASHCYSWPTQTFASVSLPLVHFIPQTPNFTTSSLLATSSPASTSSVHLYISPHFNFPPLTSLHQPSLPFPVPYTSTSALMSHVKVCIIIALLHFTPLLRSYQRDFFKEGVIWSPCDAW